LPQQGPVQPVGPEETPGRTGEQAVPRHTPSGAPTDAAHQDAGDGTLTGSTPAGLTVDELKDRSRTARRDDGGTG
jgi:hypothetical protein